MPDADTPQAAEPRPPATAHGALASTQERAGALTVALRRALWPAVAIVLVMAAQPVVQLALTDSAADTSLGAVFVVYSVLMLAVLPLMVSVGAAGASALLTKEPLPARALAVLAGIVTLAWLAWIGGGWDGLAFGAVLGVAVAGAALVLISRWPLYVRLPVAVVIALLGGLGVLLVSQPL
jgi:hypothetical protein